MCWSQSGTVSPPASSTAAGSKLSNATDKKAQCGQQAGRERAGMSPPHPPVAPLAVDGREPDARLPAPLDVLADAPVGAAGAVAALGAGAAAGAAKELDQLLLANLGGGGFEEGVLRVLVWWQIQQATGQACGSYNRTSSSLPTCMCTGLRLRGGFSTCVQGCKHRPLHRHHSPPPPCRAPPAQRRSPPAGSWSEPRRHGT